MPCVHLSSLDQAFEQLLKLPAVHALPLVDCTALATAAATASNVQAFTLLCQHLHQMQGAPAEMLPAALVLQVLQQAVTEGNHALCWGSCLFHMPKACQQRLPG